MVVVSHLFSLFIEKFTNICANTNPRLERYFSELNSQSNNEIKSLSANHYAFLTGMLDLIKNIDALSADISVAMIAADACNDTEKIRELNKLFEICGYYKRNVEEYFNSTQNILKQDDPNAISSLKQKTDELIRKTLMLKNQL